MTTLTQLDERTAAAWSAYRTATTGLPAEDYETAEELAWAGLQADLATIESERHEHAAG